MIGLDFVRYDTDSQISTVINSHLLHDKLRSTSTDYLSMVNYTHAAKTADMTTAVNSTRIIPCFGEQFSSNKTLVDIQLTSEFRVIVSDIQKCPLRAWS